MSCCRADFFTGGGALALGGEAVVLGALVFEEVGADGAVEFTGEFVPLGGGASVFCAFDTGGVERVGAEFCAELSAEFDSELGAEFSATIQMFSARAKFSARAGTPIAIAIKIFVNRLRKNSVPSLKQITDFFE